MSIKINNNIITLRGVSFDAHWEFDCPAIMLYPIIIEDVSGSISCDNLFDDFITDFVCDIKRENEYYNISHSIFIFFVKFLYWISRFFKLNKIGKYYFFTNKYKIYFDEDGEKTFDLIYNKEEKPCQ